ncbi:MAG: leucine-rich repeat protein [Bacteroidales bacterium]|jgi:hypothetical protein|nr:leucine-rich repeat protein [Bacteroidales bacterium]
MKNVYVFILIIFCCLSAVNKTMAQSGTTGTCDWALSGTSPNYTLTIKPTNGVSGAMANYSSSSSNPGRTTSPWQSYYSQTISVVIQQGVSNIGNYSFYNFNKITSVTIPNSVTTIGDAAFQYCNGLTPVTIPNSVTSIGEYAFASCSKLASITIPNSVTTIGMSAFSGCALTSINIPYSVTDIGVWVFQRCPLTNISVDANNPAYSSVDGVLFNKNQTLLHSYPGGKIGSYTIPNTVTIIGDDAFRYCSGLTSVTIPNSVTDIWGMGTFEYCINLISVIIGNSVTILWGGSFASCTKLTSITIGNSVTRLGGYNFYNCSSLTSVTIPNLVSIIEGYTFYNCSSLTSVTIGSSVTSIEDYAFYNCSSLTEMYVKAVNPPSILGTNAFYNVPTNIPVHVPCGSKTAYQNATGWSSFTNIIEDISPFDISLQSNDANMGSANVIQANNCTNNTAIIEAIPNSSCYYFVNWNDGNTQNPRTMQITSDTSVTAIFAVTVVPITANDTIVCPGTSASLTASSSVSGATYKWYSSQVASSPFHTGANYTTSNLTADTTFYLGILANGCETAPGDRKEVKVSIKSVSAASALLQELCPGLTTRIFPNKDGSWTSSDSSIVDIINSGSIIGQSAGTASLTFYDSTTTCSSSMSITVKAYPNPDEITGKTVVCEGKTIELTNTTPNGVWTKNNNNISFDNPQANPVKVTGVTKGNSFVTYTVFDGVCQTKRTFRLKVIPVSTTPPKIIIGVERK